MSGAQDDWGIAGIAFGAGGSERIDTFRIAAFLQKRVSAYWQVKSKCDIVEFLVSEIFEDDTWWFGQQR